MALHWKCPHGRAPAFCCVEMRFDTPETFSGPHIIFTACPACAGALAGMMGRIQDGSYPVVAPSVWRERKEPGDQ